MKSNKPTEIWAREMKTSSQAKKGKWLQPQEDAHPIHGREMQIKTTLRYNFSPIRLAKIQTSDNTFY